MLIPNDFVGACIFFGIVFFALVVLFCFFYERPQKVPEREVQVEPVDFEKCPDGGLAYKVSGRRLEKGELRKTKEDGETKYFKRK